MSFQYIVCGHCKTYRKEDVKSMNGWDSNEFLSAIGADVDFRCNCGGFLAVVEEGDFYKFGYEHKGYKDDSVSIGTRDCSDSLNKSSRISKYREMSVYPEISTALDMICDVALAEDAPITIDDIVSALDVCVGNIFANKREIPTVGGQMCGAEAYSVRFSGYQLGMLYEQMDMLKETLKRMES